MLRVIPTERVYVTSVADTASVGWQKSLPEYRLDLSCIACGGRMLPVPVAAGSSSSD